MPEMSFSLSRYDGPAVVNGVRFTEVHLREHADSVGDGVLKGWEGTAEVARSEAPEVHPDWALPGPVAVQLPEGGSGNAYIHGMTLTDNRYWEVNLSGTGPSPMA
ncbi:MULTISPECIES: hypothetical protein [unclassified Streptomyces]|uniref:hypothetical protein n=1 Tax=unclassified Streptomyces TaxID=2593676 RepID=UPI003BB7ACAD